jgi:hypothetical protein
MASKPSAKSFRAASPSRGADNVSRRQTGHWRRSDVTARMNARPNARWTARSNIDSVNGVLWDF